MKRETTCPAALGSSIMSDFMCTYTAQIIPIITGLISAASSSLIISIIFRCQSRLSSSYHIIMFFMSFWDIIISLAFALTTIPMPTDVGDVYPFAGKAFGSTGTCEAQGFIIFIASGLIICSHCALDVYYVSTIRYKMNEEKFKTKILPVIFIISIVLTFPIPIILLSFGLFNPRPFEPYCMYGSYPFKCNSTKENLSSGIDGDLEVYDCIRGVSESTERNLILLSYTSIGIGFLIIVISLGLVVSAVFKIENHRRKDNEEERKRNQENGGHRQNEFILPDDDTNLTLASEYEDTKIALQQALMYIAAFILTWIWVPGLFDVPKLIFRPLHGFFNALIFVYDKVVTLQRSKRNTLDADLSKLDALKIVLLSPSDIPEVVVSQIEMVDDSIGMQYEENCSDSNSAKEISERVSFPCSFESIQTPPQRLSELSSTNLIHSKRGKEKAVRYYYRNEVAVN